jgi:glyoxylase-like metal-dependent hydrolase (beta-lactamase superfamily II)
VFLVGEGVILSGDTLFVDGVGRPDLADEAEAFAHGLYDTLQRKLLTRPEDSLVLPAHYGDSVEVRPDQPVGAALGDLRAGLEVLGLDEAAFVAWASGSVSARPPNYAAIVAATMGRPSAPLADLRLLELGPNRCSVSP